MRKRRRQEVPAETAEPVESPEPVSQAQHRDTFAPGSRESDLDAIMDMYTLRANRFAPKPRGYRARSIGDTSAPPEPKR